MFTVNLHIRVNEEGDVLYSKHEAPEGDSFVKELTGPLKKTACYCIQTDTSIMEDTKKKQFVKYNEGKVYEETENGMAVRIEKKDVGEINEMFSVGMYEIPSPIQVEVGTSPNEWKYMIAPFDREEDAESFAKQHGIEKYVVSETFSTGGCITIDVDYTPTAVMNSDGVKEVHHSVEAAEERVKELGEGYYIKEMIYVK